MLLKCQRVWAQTNLSPNLSYYGAWLEWVADKDLREAMVAANINMMRREAPFLYFFANGDNSDDRQVTSSNDLDYSRSLAKKHISRGLWLTYPEWDEPTSTVITAVLSGDVLPFVYFLDSDKFSLFCSPYQYSIEQIDNIVTSTDSNHNAIKALLSNGGCIISVIDHQNFSLKTLDANFSKYFVMETSILTE